MWKILNCLAPNDINVKWNMNTRLGFKANIPNMSSNKKMSSIFESSFTVNGARLWNTLPKMINCETDFNSFKTHLDRFLLSFPDEPPIRGYSSRNNNSLLNWSNHRF